MMRAFTGAKTGEALLVFHESPCLNDVTSLFPNDHLDFRRAIAASTVFIFSLQSVFIDVESSST